MGVSLSDRGVCLGTVKCTSAEFLDAIVDGDPPVDQVVVGLKCVDFWGLILVQC